MTATVATQTPAMAFGTQDILGQVIDPTYGFRVTALGENFTFGDPEPIIAMIVSQLQDGDLERIDRFGNRSATIPLMIDAPGSAIPGDAIAHGQAAIDNACPDNGAWTTLSILSPLAGAQTSVFEVTSATVSTAFDDVAEMTQGCRYVTLTIHARPFVRPVNPVTIAAIAGSTTTNVDNGSSTTGWSLLTAQPANATNLITNPSFETNSTGWTASSGVASIAVSTDFGGFVGSQALKVTSSVGAGANVVQSSALAATAGLTYAVNWASYVQSYSDGGGTYTPLRGLSVQFYSDAGGTVTVGSAIDSGSTTNATGWVALSVSATAPAGAVSMRVSPRQIYPRTGSILPWYLDAISVTTGWLGGYFDGTTTASTAVTYAWTGTAHASTSTATVTTRTLAVVSGMVKGTLYCSSVAAIRRTGAVSMTALPYMKIVGVATVNGAGSPSITLKIADNGTDVSGSIVSSSLNPTTGAFTLILNKPSGFATSVDVTATYTGAFSPNNITTVAVDSIDITDNPWGNAATKTQTLTVSGSQRTELSLLLQGLDAPGTTAVPLGNETIVHTASAGTDGRLKFGSARAFAARAGTTDATAISGSYDTLGTTGSPTEFTFSASLLLPGNYYILQRIKAPSAVVGDLISYRAKVTAAVGDPTYDPPTQAWKTAPITAVASGALWPTVNTGVWTIVPLGMLRLPPADVQDLTATVTIQVAKGSTAVTLDDLILANADVGQASIILTALSSNSYSAVRLDAATVASPQALCWVGASNGAMIADASRWRGEQHKADPGLLQIGTVTPGCTTTRVSGTYYPRFHTNVASLT